MDINEVEQLFAGIYGCQHCVNRCSLPFPFLLGENYEEKKIMIIGQNPGVISKYHKTKKLHEALHFQKLSKKVWDEFYLKGLKESHIGIFIEQVGLKWSDILFTNIVKCAFAENRMLTVRELEKCHPWLLEQIYMFAPKNIICLGADAKCEISRLDFIREAKPKIFYWAHPSGMRKTAVYGAFVEKCRKDLVKEGVI